MSRLVVTDERASVIGVALFGDDGTAIRADLSPLRALAVARRMIEAAERKLLEAADEGRAVCATTAAVLAAAGL